MNKSSFHNVIDFAIGKEEEAVEFYRGLQKVVRFRERIQFIKELEEMEKNHIKILEDIKKMEISSIEVSEVEDLKISENLETPGLTENASYQDLLIVGMKREEEAQNLYSGLAEKTKAEDIKKLFLRLSSEEARHKQFFERIYDEEILREN